MPFRFSLEAVLKHRTRLEEIAQRDFFEAQKAVDECLRQIDAMYKRLDEVREEILAAQKNRSAVQIPVILEMEVFVKGQKIRIEKMRLQARELMSIAETKQEALIEAAKEKKVLVKLKEKKKIEYRENMNRREAKELDDIAMTRQARRKL